MNAPEIQYTRSADGTRIAFSVMGTGPPLVFVTDPFTNMNGALRLFAEHGTFLQALAKKHTIVFYDCRGSGDSDREVIDYSSAALAQDLDAVIERLRLDSVSIFALYHCCIPAIAYSVQNPQRVARLILWHGYRHYADLNQLSPQFEAVRGLVENDWRLYTETVARAMVGWTAGEEAHNYAILIRGVFESQGALRFMQATRTFDAGPLLPNLKTPVLLLHRRNLDRHPIEIAHRLAAEIADCRVTIVEGEAYLPFLQNQAAVISAIESFLAPSGIEDAAQTPTESPTTESEAPHDPLSPREREVAALVAQGLTNRQIAERLVVTEGTATLHVKHTLAKLGFRSRAQIAAWAVERGLGANRASN
jgi:pimeloyl-ACP methyl ester carboxylesterase/DNA-binding CsgD family transcriptional regulator